MENLGIVVMAKILTMQVMLMFLNFILHISDPAVLVSKMTMPVVT